MALAVFLAILLAQVTAAASFNPGFFFSSQFSNGPSVANVTLHTNIPTVNLDALPGIRKVFCRGRSFVRVVLADVSVAAEWAASKELLVVISPRWNCDASGKPLYWKTEKVSLVEGAIYFYAEKANLPRLTEAVTITLGSIARDMNVDLDLQDETLIDDGRSQIHCVSCKVKGNFRVEINITKTHLLPRISAIVRGNLYSNVDLKFTKNQLSMLDYQRQIWMKQFPVIHIENIVDLDPRLLINAGVTFPSGPISSFSAGFDVTANDFVARIGSKGPQNSRINSNGHKVDFVGLAMNEESDATVVGNFTPRLMLFLRNIFGRFDYQVGVGVNNFIEGNLQTGPYARDCDDGQVRYSLRLGTGLVKYTGNEVSGLGFPAKREILKKCN